VGAGSFQAKQQKVTLPNHKRKKKKKKWESQPGLVSSAEIGLEFIILL
jgi:hypothetical protein